MSIHRAKYLIAAAALSIATLLPGGTTAAAVERAAAPSVVPEVLGLSLGAAEDSLREAGYDYTIVNPDLVQVDGRAVVVVRQQTQDTGDADGGFVVALTRGVVMPDLLGKTLAAAEKIVARRAIAVRTSPSSAARDWTVKFQNPAAGAYMMFGDEAGLSLSEPVPPSPTPTPTTVVPSAPPTPPVKEFAGGESGRPSWLVVMLLGTAVLAVGAVGRIQHRRRPKPRVYPVPHIHAAGRLTPGPPQLKESGPAHRIRVTARLDRGHQYLQEKDDEHQ